MPRSNPPSKTTPKETTVRQKNRNREPAAGSGTPRSSVMSNGKDTTYLKIYSDQTKYQRVINPNLQYQTCPLRRETEFGQNKPKGYLMKCRKAIK
ncbi:hypothetical protein AVEN_222307-1 [Araneus ventricosus]|uniref:Uncharacterized protein n=1 Tax=Araneus ventricosus TaxID=182803 RepID=A0A4Y2ERU8_ARAVE|nr:hypothetical protein AVEN_222307-1 [Araneus ventricosus]